MSEKIAVIGDAALATGFRLSGISNVFVVEKGDQFEKKLSEIINDEAYGIVIVNELYLAGIDWKLKKKVDTIAHPVVISVADISGKTEGTEDINALIKKALGFDVSKK
jgi:V/A-type H+-transporting ATPase subunit F